MGSLQANVVKWLAGLAGIDSVKPVKVTIGKQTFIGAFYIRTSEYQSDMYCVQRSEKKAGDKYTEEFYYFSGKLPKSHMRGKNVRGNVCYTFNGETYYIVGYSSHGDKNQYQPFGRSFQMKIWPTKEFGEIDKHERYIYHRIPMTIEEG